jgi:hypothetical protein
LKQLIIIQKYKRELAGDLKKIFEWRKNAAIETKTQTYETSKGVGLCLS